MNIKIKAALVLLALLLFGCGGGGGASDSEPVQTPQVKQEREALSAQDLFLTFSEQGIAYPRVSHRVGNTEYRISAGEPEDVIEIDPKSGVISILAAGETQITVVDSSSDYKTSSTTFKVVVKQAENKELSFSDITIPTVSNQNIYLAFLGEKGEVSIDFQPEGLVRFDPATGTIVAEGIPGEVEVTITDKGDRNYVETTKSAKITIEAVEPDTLEFSPLERPYQTGLALNPVRISGSEGGHFHYELIDGENADPIMTLNEDTGLMTVLRVGEATVRATQTLGSEFNYAKQETSFTVRIELGQRPDLEVPDAVVLFDSEQLFSPAVNNSVAPVHFEVLNGDDAVEVDAQTGLLRLLGVGQAKVKAVDDLDTNFAADERLFTVMVNPAIHPGVDAGEVTYTYANDGKVTPSMKGQLGKLTLSGDTNVVSLEGNTLTILRAGTAKLTAVDDGGENYLPSKPVSLTVNVLKAPGPDLLVGNVKATYLPNHCEDVAVEGGVGTLLVTPVSSNDNNIAEYDVQNKCFQLKRSGIANFTFVREESENYLASEPKRMSVVVNPADSRLSVDGDLTRTFVEGQPTVHSPAIGGGTGNISYMLVGEKSESDVITVDKSSGDITILNAGHAVVEITDLGNDKYSPATIPFAVTIEKAVNPVSISYENTTYSPDGVITPIFNNLKGDITFRLNDPDTSPVKLVGKGNLSIRSTGTFHVYFDAAETRNYQSVSGLATAFIDLADNPGIALRYDRLEYAPLKKVTLDLPTAYGARTYSMESPTGGWVGDYLRVQADSGEISLLDYAPKKAFSLWVSEQPSDLYKYMEPQPVSYITVEPPAKGKANRDLIISESLTVMKSSVDYNDKTFEKTKLYIAGTEFGHPTREEFGQYGNGVVLPVEVLSYELIGNTGAQYQRTVRLYVQRYEGCTSNVNESNLDNLIEQKKAVNFYDGTQCDDGPTSLFLTYRVLDKSEINRFNSYDGEWETLQPFVVYRSANMLSEETGRKEEQLVEWDRIELKLTRD
ncbi:cadherin repeat domain-containing protein [Photobacterium lutimaris]|uniref:BIG2 domain-containing protein n=1 Tax=Photobacterium lutimaris TaxID=388278 RepID=A0A2T3IZG3_9GAMM|nr:cadherin repeat domain-containing protein [Photobacterium lutimaris]PSU34042.1 hypothetical protein C9I99_11840 [Photobacterium lutimaris]TDR76386.1 hypothetical protein DFP78_103383 [Photobacterium lutimaris]